MTMFERRATKGQCVNQPYLGCREFAADFRLVEPEDPRSEPVFETRDLGYMLYDLDYRNLPSRRRGFSEPFAGRCHRRSGLGQ